ncbi:LCP family protein [Paenibacillus ginsengihumi]|uniref:LCP family protein n=1 Tax=Paenibacillus ginsengihumi TaxID=431596 RepID=UPI00036B3BF8|nr:LCP family protein [Paenibacillus ginsengihumi]
MKTNRLKTRSAVLLQWYAGRSRMQKICMLIILIVFLFGVLGCVALYHNFHKSTINLANAILDEGDLENINNWDMKNEQKLVEWDAEPEDFYTLVIGLDNSDSHDGMNTDTILVAHVIPQNNIVKLLSIPRDLRVKNLRGSEAKINSIFANGYNYAVRQARENPNLLSGKYAQLGHNKVPEEYISSGMVMARETIERYMDIDIEYTFLVNYQSLISLVDLVGGIEINVERSMEYDAPSENMFIRLEPGVQVLDGEKALHYARFRKDNRGAAFHSDDFERGLRQQQIIVALIDKLNSWNNLPKVFEIIDTVSSNLKTNMTPNTMMAMVKEYYGKIATDHIYSLPFPGYWNHPYVDVEQEELEALLEQFISIDPL